MLEALAREMPTGRKKEEVPRWFVLAANLSLNLHLENSFLAFERVVRCGGLLSASIMPMVIKTHGRTTCARLRECVIDGLTQPDWPLRPSPDCPGERLPVLNCPCRIRPLAILTG